MSFLELLAKPSSRTLLDILTKLPKCGIGSRVTRKSWETYGNSYWEVTHVKPLTSDGTVGEVKGVLTWRGRTVHKRQGGERSKILPISGSTKRIWRWMPSEAEMAVYKPLIKELQRQKAMEKLAAERSNTAAAATEAKAAA